MKRTISTLPRPYRLSPAFLWINKHVSIAVILILLCHLTSARVVISRRAGDDGGRPNAMMEEPRINNNSPDVADDEAQMNVGSNNEIDNSQDGNLRDARGALYSTIKSDVVGVKHVQHLPAPNGHSERHIQAIPEESSDETFESLEANREAFLEVLTENAKHPHRKRKNKKHSNFLLKFDDKLQRWSLTEHQSEEWFNV